MVNLLQHNQKTYENIKELFKTNNKCSVVQPTGTGKSYLMVKLIEDYIKFNRDIIIIEPQRYIFDQLNKIDKDILFNSNVKFITYSMLGKMNNDKLEQFNSPVLVLVDEMHRAGAVKWGKGLRLMFDEFPDDCKYIGLSATPIRYLDGQRNISEELFDNCLANDLTLADAITKRILPLPRYIAGLYTYENEVDAITRKIQTSNNSDKEKKELLEEIIVMKRNLDKSKGISSIFKKYIVANKGKYVAFCRDIAHLNEMKPCLEEWFSDAGIKACFYEVHSKNPEKDEQYKSFKEDEGLVVCLSVGMLSEGIHGIDGVILLRDTISPNLYYQQIGRCFSVGMDTVPVIFDLVANCESIMDYGLKADLLKAIEEREKTGEYDDDITSDDKEITKEDIENFFVFDQVIDAVSAFNGIENRLVSSWDLYVRALRQYEDREGNCLVPKGHIEILEGKRGVKLGQWMGSIRIMKKGKGRSLLTEERINQLEDLNFIWDENEYKFEKNIEALKQYKNREGDCLVPNKHIETLDGKDISLGGWVSSVRSAKKEKGSYLLTSKRIKQLNEIDFVWEVNDDVFKKFYKMSLKYREKYGHVNIICTDIIDDYKIGYAYNDLQKKYKKNKLTENEINDLKTIGIDITLGKREQEFLRKLELAKQAVSEGVVLGDSNRKYKDVDLYKWFTIHKDKFTDEQLEILNKLISNGNRTPVKMIDIINNKTVGIYKSQADAANILYYDFKLGTSVENVRCDIYKRLSKKVKNPIYKSRFIIEYAADK